MEVAWMDDHLHYYLSQGSPWSLLPAVKLLDKAQITVYRLWMLRSHDALSKVRIHHLLLLLHVLLQDARSMIWHARIEEKINNDGNIIILMRHK